MLVSSFVSESEPMLKQGPSTNRERETLLLLRETLPEYEINPHMRLANVVKGKLDYIRAMGQYELDFVVQAPATGEVICAIELDDSTHDTEDGRRRDANKNRWMAQARIPLIRIRMPNEAFTIRERLNQPINFDIPEETIFSFEKKPTPEIGTKKIYAAVFAIFAIAFVLWAFNAVLKNVTSSISNKALAVQQQINQQNLTHQAEINSLKKLEAQQLEAGRKINIQPPHYERVLVRGKSVRECSIGGVINNTSVACMKDHYENVWVSGGN
jgi:hypothetical protein